MSFMFTWLRLSSNKILTWARKSNYQSKDIAWMQKVVSERMTDKVSSWKGGRQTGEHDCRQNCCQKALADTQ